MGRGITSLFTATLFGWALTSSLDAQAAGPTEGSGSTGVRPAKVEAVSGSNVKKVTLTEKAAQRLDIKTAEVGKDDSGKKFVPYAAVIYDKDGTTWVYTTSQPLTFIRHSVTVDVIQDDKAFVKEGPEPGVKVVVTGVPQLYGAEKGVGH